MLKVALVLAAATAVFALKLPILDESQVHQAYIEDAQEARPIPDVYPTEIVEEANEMDAEDSSRNNREVEGGSEPRRIEEFVLIPNFEDEVHSRPARSILEEDFGEVEKVHFTPEETNSDFEELIREKRSWQPGAPDFGVKQQDRNWGADVQREGPNTKVSVNGKHRGDGYDVEGQWSKVVRGPGKAKPDWRIGVKW